MHREFLPFKKIYKYFPNVNFGLFYFILRGRHNFKTTIAAGTVGKQGARTLYHH